MVHGSLRGRKYQTCSDAEVHGWMVHSLQQYRGPLPVPPLRRRHLLSFLPGSRVALADAMQDPGSA